MLILSGSASLALGQQEMRLDDSGQWRPVETPPPADESPAEAEARQIIAQTRALLADNRPGRAYQLIDDWVDVNERTDNPYLAEALVLRGDARTADGNEYKALYDYEQVIRDYPASQSFVDSVEREIEIGLRYLYGLKRKFLGLRVEDADRLGEELLIRAQERLPGSEQAERAAIELADYYYRERRLDLAVDMYDIFLRNFPNSAHREHAMERRIFANIAKFKGPRYDASGLVEASALIDDYQAEYPLEAERIGITGALEARIDESAAAQRLASAQWYMKRGDFVATRITLERLIDDHRGTVAATQAQKIMEERGWSSEPAPPFVTPPVEEPQAPTATPSAPPPAAPTAAEPAPQPMQEMTPITGSGG